MFAVVVAKPDFILGEAFANPAYQYVRSDGNKLSVAYSFAPKPVDDSFATFTSEGCTLFEGILANARQLIDTHAGSSTQELVRDVLIKEKHHILASLHGQFAGLCYNAVSGELRVYSNISNNFRVYYYHQNGLLIIATSLKQIVSLLKANSINYSVDELGIKMMLSYGYMLRNWTTVSEIRQLASASCLCYNTSGISHQPYFRFDTAIKHTEPNKIAPILTDLFTKAVQTAFQRDGDRRHFAFISGGLDSRMVVWTAHQLGYKQLDCLNFSQPGYLDHSIAQKICRDLGYPMSFFSLAEGNYLFSLNENLAYHEAQIVLHGAAHLFAALKAQNLSQYGIMHSGQIGDVIKGSYLQTRGHTPVKLSAGAYSTRIISSLASELSKYKADYATHEQFILENRGFNCITNGDLACLHFGYSLSAFVEPQFMQYCLNIDPALRARARMHIKWMQCEYKEASRYKWEKFNAPVSMPYPLARLKYNLWRGSDKILRKFTGKPNTLNMNPFDYWWSSNPLLKQHFAPLFSIPEPIRSLLSPELQRDISLMFVQGNLSEKFQALTAIRGIQHFFFEE